MKCKIEAQSFEQEQQMYQNVRSHQYFWGHPQTMAGNIKLSDIASYIHTLNDKDEILSYKNVNGKVRSHINALNWDIMTPSALSKLKRTTGQFTEGSEMSLEAARSMLTGTLFHDDIMKDAWGWVMERLANHTNESQTSGDFKKRGKYQLAYIPGATIREFVEGGITVGGIEQSPDGLGARFGSSIDEIFGLGVPGEDLQYSEDSLLGYLMSRAEKGAYSKVHKFKAAGKNATARVTFDVAIMPNVAEYVRNAFTTAITTFAKAGTAYKKVGIEDESNLQQEDTVYSDMLIGTEVFAFSPQRNEGGFIDLMFISEDGKRAIIDDFKTKSVLANEKYAVASPINKSNQGAYAGQLQTYMDAMRYYGTNPLMGQILPATMTMSQQNLEIDGESNFVVNAFYHSSNAQRLNLKNFQNYTTPFSSSLIPQLEQQTIVLSDFIEQSLQRGQQTRATLRSATVSDDPDIRNDAWKAVRANALILFEKRMKVANQHQDAFNQMITNFNISQYMRTALNLDTSLDFFHNKLETYIKTVLTNIRNETTPLGFIERMADELLLYQDQIQEHLLQIKALKSVFNAGERDVYVDGLIRMVTTIEDQPGLSMKDTITAIIRSIPDTFLFGTPLDNFIADYEASTKDPNTHAEFLEKRFRPAFNAFYDNITTRLENAESHTQRLASDLVVAMIPNSYIEQSLEGRADKVVVRSLSWWDRNLTRPELIDNPLFNIMTKLRDLNNQRAQRLYEERIKEFDDKHKRFKDYAKDSGLSYNQATSLLIDKSKGMLWNRFTDEFNQAKENAILSDDDKWVRDHFEIKDLDAYREDFEIRKKRYEENLLLEVALYNEELNKGVSNPQIGLPADLVEERLEEFDMRYDLTKQLPGNVMPAWANRSNLKYLKPKDIVFQNYSSEQFKKIQKSEVLLDMYNEFIKMTEEAKSVMGGGKAYIPEGFFPNVRADISEMLADGRVTKGGVTKTFGMSMDQYLEEMRIAPIDETMGVYNESTFGRSAIPFSGMTPLVSHEGNIYAEGNEAALSRNATHKSFDLHKVAHSFIDSMFHYAQYQYTEPMVSALNDFARSDRYVEEVKNRGVNALTRTGRARVTAANQVKPSAELLEKFTHYFWYGVRYKDLKDGKAPDMILSKGNTLEGKGPITLVSAVLGLRNKYSRNILSFAVISGASAGLAGMTNTFINAMESRYFDAKTLGKSWAKWSKLVGNRQQRGMMRAVALHFDSASVSTATYNAMKGTQLKNKLFSDWTLYGALRTPDLIIGDIITDAVLNNYGLMKAPETEGKKRTYDTLARLQDLPEGSKSLAEMIEVDSDGNVTYDTNIITENQVGQIKEEIRRAIAETYGQLSEDTLLGAQLSVIGTLATTFSTWMPSLAAKRFGRTKVIDLGNPKTNFVSVGRYRSLIYMLRADKLKVKEDGTVVAPDDLTEKDLLESIKQHSTNVLRNIVGTARYMLTKAAFSKDNNENLQHLRTEFWKWSANNPQEIEKLGRPSGLTTEEYQEWLFQKWLDGEKAALRSAALEMYILTAIWTLMYFAKLDYDDDGKADYKKYWAARIFMKTISKTHSELIFLLDPTQIEMLLKQPLPITGMLSDLIRVGTNSADEITDAFVGEDSPYDKSPPMYYAANYFRGFRQGRRIFEPFEQDIERGLD